ncbi:YchF/TatD family DNA exonuclease [Paenibacillus sp. SYP-B3998]|uniref:YchF/TatD family DNA exonuclease n=1 Tax=Paenibacillus sp. SYP-B3998 TaxID=2678564 RepID=A0A6G4A220_9BACL|nr:TatD family hydrolase [Paenibacillus sp. SYP-B3998]NEW07871.1 YchF/TatD family DNA exonuclease [Paenibacillus sp. SYP-B3998]
MTQFIDIGVNLMHRSFQQDREAVVIRAENEGVSPLILTGTSLRNSEESARYAGQFPGKLFATAGVHPHDTKNCTPQTIEKLRRLAALSQVVAIGECGLDYNRDFSPRDVQRKWFDEQIQLACELQLPLFLHEREAHVDFVRMLKPYAGKMSRAVVHCFTGSLQELHVYLSMGFYIGITGWICDERRGKHLRELVKRVPLDRLMIETDAPFLTPRDLAVKPQEGRNEPAFLPHIAKSIAACLGKAPEEVAEVTTRTAKSFFGLQ